MRIDIGGSRWDQITAIDERRWARNVRPLLNRQIAPIMERMESARETPELLLQEVSKIKGDQLEAVFRKEYERTGQRYFELIADQAKNKKLDPDDPYFNMVSRWVESFVGTRIKTITETSRRQARKLITEIIEDGIEDGLGADKVGERIETEFPKRWRKNNRFRAMAIARTETVTAANWASKEGAKKVAQELGIELYKEWVPAIDNRTREDHADMVGKTVRMNDDFMVGGELMKHPCAPGSSAGNVVNCRCRLAYITSDEFE